MQEMTYMELRRAAMAQMILNQRQEELDIATGQETRLTEVEAKAQADRVRDATSSTLRWLTKFTKTYNPHWKEQKKPSAWEPFPEWAFFGPLLEYIDRDDEKVKRVEKSRTMMVSWAIVGYFTLQAMLVPERQIIFQTMKDDKVNQLIEYAKCLWLSQPDWLRAAFPVAKPVEKQSQKQLEFANGSVIFGLPGGAGQMRSFHPWGYLNDETAFQPEAADCVDEALSACVKIVLNSTAANSWYFDSNNDAEIKLD